MRINTYVKENSFKAEKRQREKNKVDKYNEWTEQQKMELTVEKLSLFICFAQYLKLFSIS